MDLKPLILGALALTMPFLASVGRAADTTNAIEAVDAGFDKVVLTQAEGGGREILNHDLLSMRP